MKKILLLFALVLSITLIAIDKQYAQNGFTGKNTKQSTPENFSATGGQRLLKSKTDPENEVVQKAPLVKPQIILYQKNETDKTKWATVKWWSYLYANPGQPGC
jgi:hypothetical protein